MNRRIVTGTLLGLLLSLFAVGARAQDTAFVEHTALGGKVAVMAPASLRPMSPEMMRVKYPAVGGPTEALSNDGGNVSVAFRHTSTPLSRTGAQALRAAMERHINTNAPTARWLRSEIVRRDGREFAVFDFWSPTADQTEVRNIMVLTSVDGRALIVSFNATRRMEGEWGAIGERIVNSIRVAEDTAPVRQRPPVDTTPDFTGRP